PRREVRDARRSMASEASRSAGVSQCRTGEALVRLRRVPTAQGDAVQGVEEQSGSSGGGGASVDSCQSLSTRRYACGGSGSRSLLLSASLLRRLPPKRSRPGGLLASVS